MKRVIICAMIATFGVLAGCAHTHLRGPLPDYTGPHAATLYIQRPPAIFASAGMANHVILDGTTLGVIGPGEYWRLSLKPGKHTLGTYTTSRPLNLAPGSTVCMTVEFGKAGIGSPQVHEAEQCPPPKSWTLAAHSGKLKH